MALPSTDGRELHLATLPGRAVVYAYPRTGRPGQAEITQDWDLIPGARRCTPETCAFRDHHAELLAAGASAIFGPSTQPTEYQRELVARLNLPFPILSDAEYRLTDALGLPTFVAAGQRLLRRLTMVVRGGVVEHAFYPVFPPDSHALEVPAWLRSRA